MYSRLFALTGFVFAAFLPGQTPTEAPAFDVASIKPSDPARGHIGAITLSGGRTSFGHLTLESLIALAFEVEAFQIAGGTGWIRSEMYDIEAKPPSSSELSRLRAAPGYAFVSARLNAEQRAMLLTLLADRFQLRFHRETREGAVYFLEKGNKALGLRDTQYKGMEGYWLGSPRNGMIVGDGIAGKNLSMPKLAKELSRYLQRPVVDQTGIGGDFDFRYDYVSGDAHPDVISTIIASLEEIGLKLKAGKGPVETIVIDHAEKPSPN